MKLGELIKGVSIRRNAAAEDIEIQEVRYDSRAVQSGDLFVAIRGFAVDGHKYIKSALERGAVAIVCEEIPADCTEKPFILVDNARAALAELSANYFGHPAEHMTMIGVTGTNGKTTTTYLLKHILEQQGYRVGLIGTNQNMIGSTVLETERTTPESYELQALFARMRSAGCTHVIMEVSSHSLVLDRVRGIPFTVGAFTNLTQDHLDFHKTMENYRQAKAKLFQMCRKGVINLDDHAAKAMLQDASCPCLTFACENDGANLLASDLLFRSDGVTFTARYCNEEVNVKLGIPGHFSVENALTALGIALQLDISLSYAALALATAQGVKGRVEVVPTNTDYTVLIDYAHSPDGVQNVLRTVRGFATGRVVALFGCGGDRDKTKRPKMGAIAAQLADFCIVTSDNPRTEDPNEIIANILAGMPKDSDAIQVIPDRTEAIHWALAHAQKDDIIILMGKGHETYQEINHQKYHMDEREIVAEYFHSHA